jgi:hypothetical protein
VRRQIQVAALLVLAASACAKEKQKTDGAPYALTTARDGEGLRVDVRTSNGFHVNDEYPVSFTPEDGGRVALKDQLKKTPCEDDAQFSCAAAVPLPNTSGTLAFSVCSKENCLIEKVAIAAP